jgi:site-specific DNA-methyltransferase (adenine-specific)
VAACRNSTTNYKTESSWRSLKTAPEWKEWCRKGKYKPGKERLSALRTAKRNYLKYGSIYGAKYALNTHYGKWDTDFDPTRDLPQFLEQYYRVLKPGGTCIIFFDLWQISHLQKMMQACGFKQIRFIEWIKTNPQPLNSSRNYLTNSREVALLGVKGAKPTFHSQYDSGVYYHPVQGGKFRLMPTQKNTELIKELIEKHTNPGDVVLDTFAGSGTTAIAAHRSGREFRGCELDEEMWEKSITRIQGEIQWQRNQTAANTKRARKKRASEIASSQKLATQAPAAATKPIRNPTEDKENDTTILYA